MKKALGGITKISTFDSMMIKAKKFHSDQGFFFEKMNNIDNSLARLIRKNKIKHRFPMPGIRKVTSVWIPQILKGFHRYYEKLYSNKSDNLYEIDKFVERH